MTTQRWKNDSAVDRNKQHLGSTGWKSAAICAALVLSPSIAAFLNYEYGMQQGRSLPYIAAMICIAYAAAFCFLAFERLAKQGSMRWLALGCGVVFMALNFVNAAGLVMSARADKTSGKEAAQAQFDSLQDEVQRRSAALATVEKTLKHSTAPAARAALATLQQHPRYLSSKKCTDATIAESVSLCAEIGEVVGEIAAHERLTKERREIDGLRAELRTLNRPAVADAQAAGLARLTGLQPATVALVTDLAVAGGVELLALLPALLAAILGVNATPAAKKPVKADEPESTGDTFERWLATLDQGPVWQSNASLMASYRTYAGKGMTQANFNKQMEAAGWRSRRVASGKEWRKELALRLVAAE